jgi:predicted dehydrogenase
VPGARPVVDRAIRVGVVGLGQIAELMLPAYLARDDVDVVAACDHDADRLARWRPDLPDATLTTEIAAVLAAAPDVVDVLVPTPLHATVALPIIEAGVDVQLQKPIARSLDDCLRLTAAARANGTTLRILEDYVYFPPLVQLREVVRSGDIGEPVGVHMKIVNTGRGGWDVLPQSYVWQFEQTRDGRGMLVFDHGWHQLAVAIWLFGPITRIFGWIGATEVAPGYELDAPASLVWEHATGLRGGLDLTLATDTYFRSDFYSCDERVEVTGARGSVRCNRISAAGRQEPSLVVYRDGETREFHALADRGDAGFAASAAAMVAHRRGEAPVPDLDAATTESVMRALIAALDSARLGRPVDVDPG